MLCTAFLSEKKKQEQCIFSPFCWRQHCNRTHHVNRELGACIPLVPECLTLSHLRSNYTRLSTTTLRRGKKLLGRLPAATKTTFTKYCLQNLHRFFGCEHSSLNRSLCSSGRNCAFHFLGRFGALAALAVTPPRATCTHTHTPV